MFHFFTSWKRDNTSGFLTLSGGIETEHWREMGWWYSKASEGSPPYAVTQPDS